MKLLIIRLGSLGDILLTTPVISLLSERLPGVDVDFLTKKGYHEILKGNPGINKLILFDDKGVDRGLAGLLRLASGLRKDGYTHVIDLHGNLRSRVISMLSHGKTLRYNKQSIRRRLLLSGMRPATVHTIDAYTTAVLPIIPDARECLQRKPAIYLSQDERSFADKFLLSKGIGPEKLIIGISPGAKNLTKRWMKKGFIEVGQRCVNELDAAVLVFGSPDEASLCEEVSSRIGGATSLAGKTSLRESASLIGRCSALLSNDSGLMHVATAVDTPVVAIFGPTVQALGFSPLGRCVIVEKDLNCRPCSLHGAQSCRKGHFACMNEVDADEVFAAMVKVIRKGNN